jgi:hypothetical protein
MFPLLEDRGAAEIREHVVHTYSPSQWLGVYDIRVEEAPGRDEIRIP